MGIPYSRQINAALLQVEPLVSAGFDVLQTTKNISLLLLAIQILTVLTLLLILVVLLALLVSVNPGLEEERDLLVTPVLRWGCEVARRTGRGVVWVVWWCVVGGLAGGGAGIWWTGREGREGKGEGVGEGEEVDGEKEEETEEGVGDGDGDGEGDGEEDEKEKGKKK